MRAITWIKEHGAEFAEVNLGDSYLRAAGVAIGAAPLSYRLDYEPTAVIRYQSGSFAADVVFDGEGLVVVRPGPPERCVPAAFLIIRAARLPVADPGDAAGASHAYP